MCWLIYGIFCMMNIYKETLFGVPSGAVDNFIYDIIDTRLYIEMLSEIQLIEWQIYLHMWIEIYENIDR